MPPAFFEWDFRLARFGRTLWLRYPQPLDVENPWP